MINQVLKINKIKTVLYLKESSTRVHGLPEVLNRIYDVMRDNELSNITKKSELINIKRTIIPFVRETSNQLSNSSKILSPIADLDCVHNRKECKRRKNIEENGLSTTKKLKSLNLTRIENKMQPKTTTKEKIRKKFQPPRPIIINKSNIEDVEKNI